MSTGQAGMRVYIDGSTHPIHDNVPSLKATLTWASGETAEVQIAKVGYDLSIVVAGDFATHNTKEGHLAITLAPTRQNVRVR